MKFRKETLRLTKVEAAVFAELLNVGKYDLSEKWSSSKEEAQIFFGVLNELEFMMDKLSKDTRVENGRIYKGNFIRQFRRYCGIKVPKR